MPDLNLINKSESMSHGLHCLFLKSKIWKSERRSAVPRLDLIGGFDESALKMKFKNAFESKYPEVFKELDYVLVSCDFISYGTKYKIYLTMGLEIKKNNSNPEIIKKIEAAHNEIMEWLKNIYEKKIIGAKKAFIKELVENNGFGEKNIILDNNEFEKFTGDGSVKTIKINISHYDESSESGKTRGLDLKRLGIGLYKVDTFYLDREFCFSVERSTVSESALKRVLKIIFWVPKKIFDLIRNIFVPKKKDDEDNKKKLITDREKRVIPEQEKINTKRCCFPKTEKNKKDRVI